MDKPSEPCQLAGCFDSERDDSDVAIHMLGAVDQARTFNTGVKTGARWAIATTTPEAIAEGGGYCVTVLGSPRRRHAIQSHPVKCAAAEEILQEVISGGEEILKELSGEFLVILLTADRLVAVTDRFARKPFYFAVRNGELVFSSDLNCLMRHPQVEPSIPAQAIYNYVYFHMVPGPGTIFDDVHKLAPASRLEFRAGCSDVRIERYWTPPFPEAGTAGVSTGSDLLNTLEAAVRSSAGDCTGVGSFLSGGLDSSTVTGLLAGVSDNQAPAFTIGFDEPGYDETPYARLAAEHFGSRLVEYYTNPQDITDIVPLIARSYAQPFGNSSAVPAYCCARVAKESGVHTLLAGDGGDELFAGNTRYQKQLLFELYGHIPAAVRKNVADPLVGVLPGGLLPFRKLKSYVAQANLSLPGRLQEGYNYVNRPELQALFESAFMRQIDTSEPLKLQEAIYSEPEGALPLHRMLYLDWAFTLTDNDIVKVSRMCEVAGVNVQYPMLDDDVVDLACRVPARDKLSLRELRKFYKREMRGFLPDSILSKKKHGFGLPFGLWMKTHPALQELVSESLRSLGRRGIFQSATLDDLLRLHRESHASYFGELIWVLISLELWLLETEQRFKVSYSF